MIVAPSVAMARCVQVVTHGRPAVTSVGQGAVRACGDEYGG